MDPITLSLTKLGFALAGNLFYHLRRSGGGGEKKPDSTQVREYIQASAKNIEAAIHGAVQTIVDKLEQDQFELLLSRTRNLAHLVKMNRPDQALHYAMTLRESVDYALARFNEHKLHWLGAYMAGESVVLGTLRFANELSPDELEGFKRFILETKIMLLKEATPDLAADPDKMPWPEIARFLRGEDLELLPTLLAHNRYVMKQKDAETYAVQAPTSDPKRVENRVEEKQSAKAIPLPAGFNKQVARVLKESSLSGLHLAPNIPEEKLKNAMGAAVVPADEKVIGLIDCTFWGSATDCLVFGSRGFYFHNSGSSCKPNPGFISYGDFPAITFATAWLLYIDLGDERYCHTGAKDRTKLIEILNGIKMAIIQPEP